MSISIALERLFIVNKHCSFEVLDVNSDSKLIVNLKYTLFYRNHGDLVQKCSPTMLKFMILFQNQLELSFHASVFQYNISQQYQQQLRGFLLVRHQKDSYRTQKTRGYSRKQPIFSSDLQWIYCIFGLLCLFSMEFSVVQCADTVFFFMLFSAQSCLPSDFIGCWINVCTTFVLLTSELYDSETKLIGIFLCK